MKCPKCKGRGKVNKWWSNGKTLIATINRMVKCPMCKGKKEVKQKKD